MDSSVNTFKNASFNGLDNQEKKKPFESVDTFQSIISNEDQFDEEEYHRKTRKRLIIIGASSIILILLLVGALIGILVPADSKRNSSFAIQDKDSIKRMCNTTLYPDPCFSSIYSIKMSTSESSTLSQPDSPKDIFSLSLQVALNELVRVKSSISAKKDENDPIVARNALRACERLILDAIDQVNMSISSMEPDRIDGFSTYLVSDIRTWLSTGITDQQTCLDGVTEFEAIPMSIQEETKALMQNATVFTSNSLAMISNLFEDILGFQVPVIHKKMLETREKIVRGWVHRRLIMKADKENLRANVTVAKDGSGDYRNITEAVSSMPKRSNDRFFIHVREGEYDENVKVGPELWNLMIYGDGMNKTVVSGSLNYADGVATYDSGTFIAEGRGFIARDMGFKNTAGPDKLQAVAVRSSSDRSIFHRCLFDGYQDTLYVHTNRQFYHNCIITGTIDFIFGNAAAVFQNCTIRPRQPGSGQYNVVTAQSKSDPNQNTGLSIQSCRVSPLGGLMARTFLGRPWNNYSTTVFMETDIQGTIDPAGWAPWEPNVEPPDTIFYAEYMNTGPGSVLDGRVKWRGYRPNITEEEAEKFSVDEFIQGNGWIIND